MQAQTAQDMKKLEEQTAKAKGQVEMAPPKKMKWWMWLIIVVVIIAIALGLYFLLA